MELFKKFDETIFLKKDSELEYQLEVLKKLKSEFPNNDKIKQKLKICELGLKGEKEIEYELKHSNIGMYVLHDVNIKYEDLTAQIDYIVITPACFYFIECKNLIGNIIVNDRGEFIREYNYNGNKIKEGIYSPIRQAERHIEIFKKIWNSRNTKLINRYQMKYFDEWCKYLVVMANPKNILNVKYAPREIKNKIIRSDNLVQYLQDEISKKNKDLLSKEKHMRENALGFLNNYNIIRERDYEKELREWLKKNDSLSKTLNSAEDVYMIKDINNLREQLIEFRRITSKEKGIPAYYVFTNDELEKLIEYKPKDIEMLKQLKILTDIKIKVHGENIVDIIRNFFIDNCKNNRRNK